MFLLSLLILVIPFSACQKKNSITVDKTPTKELTVYIPSYDTMGVSAIIPKFEAKYGLTVTTVNLKDEDYQTYSDRVNTELMAGNGPDVVFPSTLTMNPYKAMDNKLFLDLKPYFEQDTEFKSKDYFQPVLNAGFCNEKQYIVPLSFTFPAYISSTEHLKVIGFDWKTAADMPSFLKQISAALPAAQQISGFSQMMEYKNYFIAFLPQSGLPLVDYKQKKIGNNPDAIRSFFEAYKSYFQNDYKEDQSIYTDNLGYKHMLASEYYFKNPECIEDLFCTASVLKTNGGYTLSALRDYAGKIHAIADNTVAVRANSKNKWNAYRFIKFLLSEDNQTSQISAYPVNIQALSELAKKAQEEYSPSKPVNDGYICTKLSDDETQTIVKLLSSADTCDFMDQQVIKTTYDTMLPYFQDAKSYDACYQELQ